MQGKSHLTITVHPLFTYNGSFHATLLPAAGLQPVSTQFAGELRREVIEQILPFIISEAAMGIPFSALFPVKHVGRFKPYIPQTVNIQYKFLFPVMQFHDKITDDRSDYMVRDTAFFEYFFRFAFSHLNYHARFFAEHQSDQIFLLKNIKIDIHSHLVIREVHFQQGGDQSSCRHIMACQDKFFANKLL